MGAGSYPPAASPTPRSRLHVGRLRWRPFSTGITALTVTIPQPGRPRESSAPEPPSRWRTPEFWLYYVVFALALPYMAKVVVDLSRGEYVCALRRSPCRIAPKLPTLSASPQRRMDSWVEDCSSSHRTGSADILQDTSDHQWNVFRNNIPVLGALVLLWLLASRLFFGRALSPFTPADGALEAVSPSATPELASTFDSTLVSPSLAPPPINSRLNFILYFAAPLLVMLHGTSVLKIFVLLSLNFGVSRLTTTLSARGGTLVRAVPLLTWGLNIGLLFANELCDGYRFAHLSPALGFLVRVCTCGWTSTDVDLSGRRVGQGHPAAVAHQLEHHHAPPRLVQYGPLLGSHRACPDVDGRRACVDRQGTSGRWPTWTDSLVHLDAAGAERAHTHDHFPRCRRVLVQVVPRLRPLPPTVSRRPDPHVQLVPLAARGPACDIGQDAAELHGPFPRVPRDDGDRAQLDVRRRNQRLESCGRLDGGHPIRAKHDRVLESHRRLAQGGLFHHTYKLTPVASHPLALFPPVVLA